MKLLEGLLMLVFVGAGLFLVWYFTPPKPIFQVKIVGASERGLKAVLIVKNPYTFEIEPQKVIIRKGTDEWEFYPGKLKPKESKEFFFHFDWNGEEVLRFDVTAYYDYRAPVVIPCFLELGATSMEWMAAPQRIGDSLLSVQFEVKNTANHPAIGVKVFVSCGSKKVEKELGLIFPKEVKTASLQLTTETFDCVLGVYGKNVPYSVKEVKLA